MLGGCKEYESQNYSYAVHQHSLNNPWLMWGKK